MNNHISSTRRHVLSRRSYVSRRVGRADMSFPRFAIWGAGISRNYALSIPRVDRRISPICAAFRANFSGIDRGTACLSDRRKPHVAQHQRTARRTPQGRKGGAVMPTRQRYIITSIILALPPAVLGAVRRMDCTQPAEVGTPAAFLNNCLAARAKRPRYGEPHGYDKTHSGLAGMDRGGGLYRRPRDLHAGQSGGRRSGRRRGRGASRTVTTGDGEKRKIMHPHPQKQQTHKPSMRVFSGMFSTDR